MLQTIEELQSAPYGEIVNALADLAPQVIAAREQYEALVGQQRALTAARELVGAGLRIGDRVQLSGRYGSLKNPIGITVGANSAGPLFQLLTKDGDASGSPRPSFQFEGFEKI